MNILTNQFAYLILFAIGLALMIGGIALRVDGTVPIGLIVAAVNFQHWHKRREEQLLDEKKEFME